MRHSLLRFSNTGAGIKPAVYLLSGQALLAGIFCGIFDITAHSMFLSLFDEKILARAYILSGITGFIFSTLFILLQKKIPFGKLSVIILLLVSSVTLVLWILLLVMQTPPLIFILFLMMGPLNILMMLVMDGTVFCLTEKEREDRLYSFTNAALPAGIIAGCFSIPVLIGAGIDLRHFILFGFIAAAGAAVMQIYLQRIMTKDGDNQHMRYPSSKKASGALTIPRNSLQRKLAVVTLFSVVAASFIQYSFLAVSRVHYPTMQDLAHFLGLFTGIVMTFALIVKFIVFPFLIRNFRLQTAIVFTPFLIAVLTTGVLLTGHFTGSNISLTGISGFFILLALSRFFSRSFKESIELSSAEILLQSVEGSRRYTTLTGLKGPVNESGTIIAGIILTLMGIIGPVKLIHFPMVLLVLTILWIILAFRLYSVYRSSLVTNEANHGKYLPDDTVSKTNPVWENRISAQLAFNADFYKIITGDQAIPENSQNKWYLNKILEYADIKKDINFLPALKKIRSGSGISREIKQRASEIIQDLELSVSGVRNMDERLKAMMLLAQDQPPHIPEVIRLLRDPDNDLKLIALNIIRKFRFSDLLPEVCACLDNNYIAVQAENVLKSFGSEADQPLRRFYLLSQSDSRISATILKILGKNCSSENTEFLFSLLWTASRLIREAGLKNLAGCNYNLNPDEKEKLLRVINDVIGIITWNMSAGICLGRMKNRIPYNAMLQENRRWMEYLFDLLAVTYGSRISGEIRNNIEEGSGRSVSHALEIINIITDEHIKSRLTVLLDRIPDNRKLRTLFRYYPGEIPAWNDLVGYIINRDYNLLGVWIRACIIRQIPEITGNDMGESLIALLFSPEKILIEETANLLSRSGKEYFTQASDRLPQVTREAIDTIITGKVKDYELLYNKVIFLKSLFSTLPEESLYILAGSMVSAGFLLPEYLPRESGYILWECHSGTNYCTAGIFYDNILRKITVAEEDSFCYILPLVDLENYLGRYPEHTLEIFKYIDEIERRNQ